MKVLVVGAGGREHALAWGLSHSALVTDLHAAPGNAGIARLATCHPVQAGDVEGLVALSHGIGAGLVVVGPEAPLVAGLADVLREQGIATFGPGKDGARIEGSKTWAKELMGRANIPTARAGSFTRVADAVAFLDDLGGRAVVKADGLAAGKGVTVAGDRATAVCALTECLEEGAFGDAGATVVVEEMLEGPEVSAFALCDGDATVPLVLSQDFKRIGDGDTGPNTGGMGAYSPLPFVDERTEAAIWELTNRAAETMAAAGIEYRGLLYAGFMLTAQGPKVLEFNCRFGDPETEVVIPRLGSDLAEILMASATGTLADVKVAWSPDAAVTVVLASGGYPGAYRTGVPIRGLDDAGAVEGATVFHAGTAERDGTVVTAGGRVLSVTGVAATLQDARAVAYEAAGRIVFDGLTYRTDIRERGARAPREAESEKGTGR
jgi:phosphoribosylamine---glycine ligase